MGGSGTGICGGEPEGEVRSQESKVKRRHSLLFRLSVNPQYSGHPRHGRDAKCRIVFAGGEALGVRWLAGAFMPLCHSEFWPLIPEFYV